jgi:hypothetical protein
VSERDLVQVARSLADPRAMPVFASVVRRATPLPPRIGRSSMRALEDALAKGLVLGLARSGASHRAWAHVPPPHLHFGAPAFVLLRWLLETPVGSPKAEPPPVFEGLGIGEQLLFLRVRALLLAAGLPAAADAPAFVRVPLIALHEGLDAPGVAELARGDAASIVFALADEIATQWEKAERTKAAATDPQVLLARGLGQRAVLERFVPAALPDVLPLRFLLELLRRTIPDAERPFDPRTWPCGRALDPGAPLGLRVDARRAGLAPFVAMGRIAGHQARLRAVGFVDDGYDEAQAGLRALEPFDEGRFARAAEVVRAAEQLVPIEA